MSKQSLTQSTINGQQNTTGMSKGEGRTTKSVHGQILSVSWQSFLLSLHYPDCYDNQNYQIVLVIYGNQRKCDHEAYDQDNMGIFPWG